MWGAVLSQEGFPGPGGGGRALWFVFAAMEPHSKPGSLCIDSILITLLAQASLPKAFFIALWHCCTSAPPEAFTGKVSALPTAAGLVGALLRRGSGQQQQTVTSGWLVGHWVLCAVLGAAPMWVHGLGCSWLESFPAAPNAFLSGFSSSPCFRTFCGMLFIAATTTSFNLEFYYSQRRLLKAAAPLSPLAQPHELIVSNHPRSKMSLLSSPLENATSCSYFLLNEKGKMKS